MDPQLAQQLRQVMSIQLSSGTANAFGEIQVGSVATLFCRLENRVRSVERIDGTFEKTMSPLIIVNSGGVTPTMNSRIWLPGTSSSTAALARKPTAVEHCIDEYGNLNHYEISV